MDLPPPSPEASAHSGELVAAIGREIAARGGWIPFARFMELALYALGLGYYSAGAQKFGAAGDFVTAPEMSAYFGRALARQVAQVMEMSQPLLLEVGAGSGRLAADLLLELDASRRRVFEVEVRKVASAGQRYPEQAVDVDAAVHAGDQDGFLDRHQHAVVAVEAHGVRGDVQAGVADGGVPVVDTNP